MVMLDVVQERNTMKCDFDLLVPAERGLILVASEEKYKELTSQVDWKRLSWLLLLPLGGVFTPLVASSLSGPALASLGVTKATRGLKTFFRKGEIPIPHLAPADAASRFKFDHGHPQDGTAYVQHATRTDYYLVPASANERLAQEKVSAFLELASALGAKKLELLSAEILEQHAKVKADVPLKEAAAQVGIEASFGASGGVNRMVYSEFGEPKQSPHVPDEISGWLDVDPMFRSLSNTRLDGELHKTKATLKIDSTLDYGASVLVSLSKFNVSVGGEYHKVARSVWSFEIEFWPKV